MPSSLFYIPSKVFGPLSIVHKLNHVFMHRNFEQQDLSYEEWKSVLHLSTRWDCASIRRLALNNIQPPTPHDRLLLARTYSVNDWVVPALSELCERRPPLSFTQLKIHAA